MATKVVCSVHDTASDLFGQPFFVPAPAAAIRSVGDETNRQAADNPLYNHPEDFVLYSLGTFDDVSGAFTSEVKIIARVKDLAQSRF